MSFPKNPNSEQLFRSAFTQPTLSSSLLNQIKQHSIYLAIVKLVAIYVTLADENPRQAEASLSPRSSVASWPTLTNKIGRLSTSRRRSSILDFLPSVKVVVQDVVYSSIWDHSHDAEPGPDTVEVPIV